MTTVGIGTKAAGLRKGINSLVRSEPVWKGPTVCVAAAGLKSIYVITHPAMVEHNA